MLSYSGVRDYRFSKNVPDRRWYRFGLPIGDHLLRSHGPFNWLWARLRGLASL